jgi:hypothetical protein
MSKKIDESSKRLRKAIKKHAEIVGGNSVTLKKAQRSAAAIQEAAIEYALLVQEKTGIETPFPNLWNPGLEASTVASLISERDALIKKTTNKRK